MQNSMMKDSRERSEDFFDYFLLKSWKIVKKSTQIFVYNCHNIISRIYLISSHYVIY